ncbi:MAG: hypothetical protein LIO53_02880 [Oscillospiraceae bacterium]|nr:hypothetical protein [Oscillospiraceae bacterium]
MYGYETFHEELMKNLIESVHRDESSHAYIFEGESGLGKRNSARLFAAALTCVNTKISPCGACQNCIESKADTNPDIIYVRPRDDRKTIGVKDMRSLEENAAIKPFNSARKVYIMDGSLLTAEAQNVFLKTLEEPPEYAVFIILIENSTLLLQTVLSRCVLVHFPAVSDDLMEKYILSKYPESENRLEFLLKYCEGVPGRADSVINDEGFETLRSDSLEKLFYLLSADRRAAFVIEKFLEENKPQAAEILNFWLSFLRDAALIQTGAAAEIINTDKKAELRRIASKFNPERIIKMSEKVINSEKMIARYIKINAVAMWLALD